MWNIKFRLRAEAEGSADRAALFSAARLGAVRVVLVTRYLLFRLYDSSVCVARRFWVSTEECGKGGVAVATNCC